MNFVRVKPGMADRYDNDLRANWKRTMDEAKRQGLILSYKTLYSQPGDRDDWDVLVMVEYRNMAALDHLRERFDPIMTRMMGDQGERESRSLKREEVREVVGGRLAREFMLRDSIVERANR